MDVCRLCNSSDSASFSNFCNDFAGNVIIFGIDNSSLSQTDNRKNNFLLLEEVPTNSIEESFGSPKKKFSINFSEARARCSLSLHYMVINIFCLLTEKKFLILRPIIKTLNFQLNFI